ncbi:MAG: hypothetical protein K9L89_08295, partial [Kiritimatiellales bacterium]|nr:hypothetical protein [Kiritimatiellales bacterium]
IGGDGCPSRPPGERPVVRLFLRRRAGTAHPTLGNRWGRLSQPSAGRAASRAALPPTAGWDSPPYLFALSFLFVAKRPYVRPLIWRFNQSSPHGVHANVMRLFDMAFIVTQAMVEKIPLPPDSRLPAAPCIFSN